MKRWMLRCSATLSVLLLAGSGAAPTTAAPGGNSANAKACQKGGWETRARADDAGTAFVSQDECVSYGAEGGVIVSYVAPLPTTVPEDPAVTRCKQEAAAAGFDPSRFGRIFTGTEGSDSFHSHGNARQGGPDLVCGFGGADTMEILDGEAVFLGGDGDDILHDMDGGTFNGGAGIDHVGECYFGGTYNGGAGLDTVQYEEGCTFNRD